MNGRSVSKKIKQHQGIKITYDVKLNEISSIDVKRENHILNIVIHLFSICHRK